MRREATAGFEPAITVLQTAALPLGYVALMDAELYLPGRAGWPAEDRGLYSSQPCQIALLATA